MPTKSEIRRQALNLPARERIEIVVELWDSLAPGEIPVPDWQRDLIRDRLAALEEIPAEQPFGALGSGPQAGLLRRIATPPVRLTSAEPTRPGAPPAVARAARCVISSVIRRLGRQESFPKAVAPRAGRVSLAGAAHLLDAPGGVPGDCRPGRLVIPVRVDVRAGPHRDQTDFPEGIMRMRTLWVVPASAVLAAAVFATAPATPRAQETTENPFTTTLDIRMGQRLYQQQCTRCHGQTGDGGELGPALTNGFSSASTDAGLFRIVREGIPNTQMIGISRNATDQSVWMVVSYLNSLNSTPAVDLPGDVGAGRMVFEGKGNCSSCHMVNGAGGRRGPDLSRVGDRRDPDELVSDLRAPDEDLAPRWWTLRVTREDGSVVEGLRMSEDTFTMRVMDENEDLWSFSKGGVRSYDRVTSSIMPSVNALLTEDEVEDLIAYLYSLRREET